MKKFIFPIAALAVFAVSCTGNKENNAESGENVVVDIVDDQVAAPAYLQNQWILADYPGGPEIDIDDETQQYVLNFNEDGTFGFSTDCNSIGGEYTVNGDSITFSNIAVTQMECPQMVVEENFKTTLPMIDTFVVTDSTLTLRADARIMANFKALK